MQEKLGTIFAAIGMTIAAVAAVTGTWCYYIWSFDWGHFGGRGWGLWGMLMMFGAVIIFFGIFFVVWLFLFWLLSLMERVWRY